MATTITIQSLEAELTAIQTAMASTQAQITKFSSDLATFSASSGTGTTKPTETASGTSVTSAGTIIHASNTTGSAPPSGSTLDTWTFNSAGQAVHNGVVDSVTANVTGLYYLNHTVWQHTPANGTANAWYVWTGEVAGSGGVWVLNAAGPVPSTTGSTLIQVPFGVHLGSYLGGGQGTEGSIKAHWNDVVSEIVLPKVLAAVMMNSYQDGNASPAQWGGDVYNWTAANGIPVDGSVVPLLHGHFTNGTSTDVDYAGVVAGTYDTALQNALNLWKKIAPFKKIYFRINWEFNTDFRGWGVPNTGQIAASVAAWKHWCNVCHTWGNANGIEMRMVWSPDTSYTNAESTTFTQPVINFFPAPDSNAVGGRYIDVIASDNYMNGYGYSGVNNLGSGYTTPLASNTNWSLGTFVAMCQAYKCNLGISETGDDMSIADKNNSWNDGVMAEWATYLNTLSSLNPAVPIEYIALFDVTVDAGSGGQCTGGGSPNMCKAWNCAFGSASAQPNTSTPISKIMTVAPI